MARTQPKGPGPPRKAAAPRPAPAAAKRPVRARMISIRGRDEWLEWVRGLADAERMDVSDLIDRALVDYGKARGYPVPAPRR
jgi:hypothetical protein